MENSKRLPFGCQHSGDEEHLNKTMKRKTKTIIKEQPFWSIIAEEWSQAKKRRPSLTMRQKPIFYWHRKMNGHVHGWCACGGLFISISDRYLKHNITGQDFRNIIRHELAHVGTGNGHGEAFKNVLAQLGGTRYATAIFPKKTLSPEVMERKRLQEERLKKQKSICHSCKELIGNSAHWNWKCGKTWVHHSECMPCKNPVALCDIRLSKEENLEIYNRINKIAKVEVN
ncbi:MAG: hypothetical protein ACYDBV_14450 [Nitrospiria bacterium]